MRFHLTSACSGTKCPLRGHFDADAERFEWTFMRAEVGGEPGNGKLQSIFRPSQANRVWRVPKIYKAHGTASLLESLPCIINLGSLYVSWEIRESLKNQTHFTCRLQENAGHENGV